jgi:hypothetical protein
MSLSSKGSVWRRIFLHDTWNVGIIYEPIHQVIKSGVNGKIRWLLSPRQGEFFADPFGVVRDNQVYLLCERFDYSRDKGSLVAIHLRDGEKPAVLDVDASATFHVSYPYLIEVEKEIYCVPETAQSGEVSLYRATEFPTKWEKVGVLISGVAVVDPTIIHHEGRWWLWGTDARRGSNAVLMIWYANSLIGPWQPHAGNPVKVSPGSSRPAGTPYKCNNVLYRPAQDCSMSYGRRIVINRVVRVDPEGYEEKIESVLEPDPESLYPDGLHTISALGGITLVDARRTRFTRQGFRLAIRRGLRRCWRCFPG